MSAAGPEPSYFEIPSKDSQTAEDSIHEVPTKDMENSAAAKAAQANTSFTIEFDNTSPGKVTIKDHVSRPRSKKSQPGSKELSSLQAAIMASESKVADWLAHNNPPMVRRESTEEDSKSIKSDVPVHLKRLKGKKHQIGKYIDSDMNVLSLSSCSVQKVPTNIKLNTVNQVILNYFLINGVG